MTKPGTDRWKNELLYEPRLTYFRKFATVAGAESGRRFTSMSPRFVWNLTVWAKAPGQKSAARGKRVTSTRTTRFFIEKQRGMLPFYRVSTAMQKACAKIEFTQAPVLKCCFRTIQWNAPADSSGK